MANDKPYIGQMDRVIKIFRIENVRNNMGDPQPTDVLVCKPWAQMKDVSGSQEVEGSIVSTVRRSYTVYRNREVVQNGRAMFVVDGTDRFAITAIKEIGRTHLELIVEIVQGWVPADNGGENPGGGDDDGFEITNQLTGNYLLAGSEFNLQIETNQPALSYQVSFLPDYLSFDAQTGIITGILPMDPAVILFQIMAYGAAGDDAKTYGINLVDYDINQMAPPFNVGVLQYNTIGISFQYQYSVQYYAPQYERLEFFVNDVLYRVFEDGNPIEINGEYTTWKLMQRVPAFPTGIPFEFKCRFKNLDGDYSAFSEALMITIPAL